MATKIADLMVRISTDMAEFNKGLNSARKELKTFGKNMTTLGKSLTAAITLPLAAIGTAAVASSEQVDEAMDTIRQGTGATGDALKALGEDFRAVFTSLPNTAAETSQAIADLNTRAGANGEALQELARQELMLAKMTKQDVAGTIADTTRLFGDWSVATAEQAATLDLLWKTSQTTGVSVSSLSENLVKFGAPLRQMGFDLQTSAALLGKFEKEGVNAELVMGSLRIALGKMAKEGISDPAEALRVMIRRIQEAGSAGEANTLALEMFGARAGPDMAAAIREGRFEIDGLLSSLSSSNETIAGAYSDTMGLAEAMGVLKNMTTDALAPLGQALVDAFMRLQPQIEKAVDFVSGLIEGFSNLSPETQNVIMIIGGLLLVLGPLLMFIGSIAGALSTLIPILTSAGVTIGAVTFPVWAVGAAIAALVAGIVLLYNKSEAARVIINGAFKAIGVTIGAVFRTAVAVVTGAIKLITAPIQGLIKLAQTAFGWLGRLVGAKKDVGDIPTEPPADPGDSGQPPAGIPKFHSGGIFRAPRLGGEGLALLKDRETVLPAGAAAMSSAATGSDAVAEAVGASVANALRSAQAAGGGGNITIPIYLDGGLLDEVIVSAQARRNARSNGR